MVEEAFRFSIAVGFSNKYKMFQEELTLYSEAHRRQPQPSLSPSPGDSWRANSEIEHEIFSSFMRKTGRELSHRESALMAASQQLIEVYGCHRKKEIDSSRTLDTMLEESANVSLSLEEERMCPQKRPQLPFSSRKHIASGDDFLKEVQDSCSYGCYGWVSGVVAEYKRLENKIKNYEAKELALLKRE